MIWIETKISDLEIGDTFKFESTVDANIFTVHSKFHFLIAYWQKGQKHSRYLPDNSNVLVYVLSKQG